MRLVWAPAIIIPLNPFYRFIHSSLIHVQRPFILSAKVYSLNHFIPVQLLEVSTSNLFRFLKSIHNVRILLVLFECIHIVRICSLCPSSTLFQIFWFFFCLNLIYVVANFSAVLAMCSSLECFSSLNSLLLAFPKCFGLPPFFFFFLFPFIFRYSFIRNFFDFIIYIFFFVFNIFQTFTNV